MAKNELKPSIQCNKCHKRANRRFIWFSAR
nr:MAG TPA: hypothetical protein [Caudoviricetes sp.]